MPFRTLLLAAAALLPGMAAAQPVAGFYAAIGGGANTLQDLSGGRQKVTFGGGSAAAVSLGYGFGNGLRAEIEGAYRRNGVDSMQGFGVPVAVQASGSVRSYGAMLNLLYEADLAGTIGVAPYLGLGFGYQRHDYVDVRARAGRAALLIDDGDANLAYQAILGVALPVAAVPGLAVTAEYRFMGSFTSRLDAGVSLGLVTRTGTAEFENHNHSLMLGLRFAFGAAPLPAEP